jgi:molybdopterin converting factor small subunit
MIKIVFLGQLQEMAGTTSTRIEGPISLSSYLLALEAADVILHTALTAKGVRIAFNLAIIALGSDIDLNDGDELAFMPPFSGG